MATPDVDTSTLVEMSGLIEQLTTSGKSTLDEKTLKQLKKICRMSDGYVKQAYRLTIIQLEKSHAEIRLSAVQLVNELFLRSHCFREMLLAEFQHFMELTLETDLEKPLPLPVRMAKELKKQSIKFIHDWFTKFGVAYKQLALGYNFLINCKKVNFVNIQAQTVAEERLAEERRTKRELHLRTRARTALEEMQETSAEIRLCLTEAESCMNLLIPSPDAFDIFDPAFDCSTNEGAFKTEAEMTVGSNHRETDVQTDRVVDDDDNNTPGVRDLVNSDETVELNDNENKADSQICNICPPVHGQALKDNGSRNCKHVNTKDDVNCEDDKDDASSDDDDDDDGKYDSDFNGLDTSRIHGILSVKTNLNITIKNKPITIHENDNNADLLVTLRDQVTLAQNKLLPSVKRWLDAFTKANGHEADMRSALDFKMHLENMLKKAEKLHVTAATRPDKSTKEGDSDDDDDFVEVPEKEGYEPYIPAFLREEYGLNPLRPLAMAKPSTTARHKVVRRKENDNFSAEDPTSWAATLKKMKEQSSRAKSFAQEDLEQKSDEPQPSTSKEDPSSRKNREDLLKKAPIIPYGNDLYHWGDDIEAPLMVRNDSDSKRWWTSHEPDDKIDDMALAAIKQRTINFVGKFKPVKWHCRAPLPTGNLCTRMDRFKCPFHGKIIPRDEHGVPNGPDNVETNAEEVDIFEQKSNGWDDPELQADIFAATGIDLSLKKTRKGKGKNHERRFPELTDLKTLENTTRKRLEGKLFSKATVKRVAQSLDDLDAKRHREKFGNNFNYSCQL